MSWSKDNGKSAKEAAAEALAQAIRAEQASDYIDEKQPLIEQFTGGQTSLQAQINEAIQELELIKEELSIETKGVISEVERPTNIPVAGGFYGTSHGNLVAPENAWGWFHIKVDIGTSRKFKVISALIGTVRVVMLRAIGVVIETRVINVNEIFEAHEDAAHISINIQTPNAVPPTTATTVFPNANGFSINEIVFAEAGITPITLKERVVGLENSLNDLIENLSNNPEPTTKTMKILMLGNSFSLDALQHLYDMARSVGIKLVLGISYDANGGLAAAWTKAQNNTPTDSYHKWTEAGYVVATGRTLNFAVLDEDWDIITYQQVSGSSGDYASFQPALNNIHNYVRGRATNPNVKFGLHMTWAYATGSSNLASTSYPTQSAMYEAIANTYLQAMQAMNFDILIPSGTAIQNARSNSYLRAIGTDLTRDGYHLNEGVGRYIAALTVFESLLAPYYKKNIYNEVAFFPTNNGGTRFLAFLAKRAAKNAVLNPFKITNL